MFTDFITNCRAVSPQVWVGNLFINLYRDFRHNNKTQIKCQKNDILEVRAVSDSEHTTVIKSIGKTHAISILLMSKRNVKDCRKQVRKCI